MPRPWWIRSVARTLGLNPAPHRTPGTAGSFRPGVQSLEDRTTPAVVTFDDSTNPAKLSLVLDSNSEQLAIQSLGSGVVRYTTTGTFSGNQAGTSFDLIVVPGSPVQVSITDAPTITLGFVRFLDSGANAYPAVPTTINLDNDSGGVQFNGTTDFGSSALSVTGDATISFWANAAGAAHLSTTTDLLLAGDRLNIQTLGANASTINAGTATVRIRPASSGQKINIGGEDFSGFLGLTDDELDRITAGAIEIGSGTAGDAKITAPISPAKTSNLSITTGGKLFLDPTYPGGTAVTVAKLTLSTGTGAGTLASPLPIDVDNLEATGKGNVFVSNDGALTIGGASAASGIQVTGTTAVVSVAATGTLTVNEAVQAPGNIILTATGATSDVVFQHNANRGVSSSGGTTTVTADRNITIGTASGYGDVGGQGLVLDATGDVVVDATSYVESFGPAGMQVTAGGDVKILHEIGGGSVLNSNGGGANVTITTGAGKAFILDQGSNGGVAANGGDITIAADNMVLTSGCIGTTELVTLKPVTAGRAISLGAETAGQLSLTQAELNLVTVSPPVTEISLQIGDAASGAITVAADLTRPVLTHLTLASGGVISPASAAAGSINTDGGSLTLAPGTGGYTPVRSGTDATTPTAAFASGSGLSIVINGTAADTGYTRFVASGTVDLSGVDLVLSGGYAPAVGEAFTVVSAAGRTGEFTDLPDGTVIPFNGRSLRISYTATAVTLAAVDIIPPDTTITSAPPALTNSSPTFAFTGVDDANGGGVSYYFVRIDGGAYTEQSSPYTIEELTDGVHTFEVVAVDTSGNADPTPATAVFTVDATGPSVSISGPVVVGPGVIEYTVTYADANFLESTLDTGDVALNRSGSANGTVSVTGAGTEWKVRVSGITGVGNLSISVGAGTATDTLGNESLGAGPSAVIAAPPRVSIGRPSVPRVTAGQGSVSFLVTYPSLAPGAVTLTARDVVLHRTGTANGVVTVTRVNATTFRVTVSRVTGSGTLGISVRSGTAVDGFGQAAPAAGPSAAFQVVPPPAPFRGLRISSLGR